VVGSEKNKSGAVVAISGAQVSSVDTFANGAFANTIAVNGGAPAIDPPFEASLRLASVGLGALAAGGKTMSLGGRRAASKKLWSRIETQINPPPIIGSSTIANLTNIKLCLRTLVSASSETI
jgi:hypothetical protein